MSRNDPATYRKMSEPHATLAEAHAAAEAFGQVVVESRLQHKLRDVYVLVRTPYMSDDGDEVDLFLSLHLGNAREAVPMLAEALGAEEVRREEDTSRRRRQASSKPATGR